MTPEEARAAGYRAYFQYGHCPHYAGYLNANDIDPADAMKFFLPPEKQSTIQVHQPRSPERTAWIEGWKEARSEGAK